MHHKTGLLCRYVYYVVSTGDETTMRGKGRHDPCVLPRAVPMVEAMVSLVILDALMQQRSQCSLFEVTETFDEGPKPAQMNPLGKKLTGFGRDLA